MGIVVCEITTKELFELRISYENILECSSQIKVFFFFTVNWEIVF